MIKSVIIIVLVAIIGYSYVTNTSVKSMVITNDVKFRSPITMRNI